MTGDGPYAPVTFSGEIDGEETEVYLKSGIVRVRPHVFELIESALERRGLPYNSIHGDPNVLRMILVEDVFDKPTVES